MQLLCNTIDQLMVDIYMYRNIQYVCNKHFNEL